MNIWKAIVFGLAVLGGCGKIEPEPTSGPTAPPQPAVWKIADADTTVYLFGTVHVLPPDLSWRSPTIDKAFDESKAIYFETDTEGDQIAFREMLNRLGFYSPSERLSDQLALNDLKLLTSALAKLDMPLVAIEPMRPWYAGVVISDVIVRKAGYDVNSGVESVMRSAGRSAGKQIRFLETIEQQMSSFATLPEDIQIRFLIGGLGEIDLAPQKLDDLVKAWTLGDVDSLHRLLIDEDLGNIPELYDSLLTHRNANWAAQIDSLMDSEAGTFLVAVGAAHLIGKDSVLEMLKTVGDSPQRLGLP